MFSHTVEICTVIIFTSSQYYVATNQSFLMDSIQYRTELLVFDALEIVFFAQRKFINVNN